MNEAGGAAGEVILRVLPFRGAGNRGEKHSCRDDLLDDRGNRDSECPMLISTP